MDTKDFHDQFVLACINNNVNNIGALDDAKYALKKREENIFYDYKTIEEFISEQTLRFPHLMFKKMNTPFGICGIIVEKEMLHEFADWLKKEKNFDIYL